MGMAKMGLSGGSEGGEGKLKVVDEGFVRKEGMESGGGDEDRWWCHGGGYSGLGFSCFFLVAMELGISGEMDDSVVGFLGIVLYN